MSIKLKPYSEYANMGVPWLSEIPRHWAVAQVKRHFSIQLGKMLQSNQLRSDEQLVRYLKARHVQWFAVSAANLPRMWASSEEIKRYGVEAGDLLVCEGGEGGRCGILTQVDAPCIIQNALHRVRAKGTSTVEYLQYVMSVVASSGWFDAINNKATIAHFTREKFGALSMPVPPAIEQGPITAFLNQIDKGISYLIRARRQQIKLLNEQKQVIINHAVTRGLDPNVGMKPSGIEWLGDVPEHWQMTRLKYLAQFVSGGTPSTSTPSFWNGNIPWVSPKDMKYFEIRDTRDHVTERAIQAGKTALVPAGAVLMVVRSGILQRTIPVAVACREVAINQDLKAIIVDDELLVPEFLSMVVIGNQQALLALWRKQGATVESLEYKWILNTVFPVPPVQEQRAILTVLLPRLMEIEKTIEHVQREIDLLHEYRTRLIADVVTGKLDVRGGELPDIDVSEGLDEWDEEEGIGQEEIIEPEEMDVDEYN